MRTGLGASVLVIGVAACSGDLASEPGRQGSSITVSPEITFGACTYELGNPAAAARSRDGYLVAGWAYNDICANLLDAEGNVRGPAFRLHGNNVYDAQPAIASDGTDYLVAWVEHPPDASDPFDICWRRVRASGAIDGPVTCSAQAGPDERRPSLAFDGAHYLLVFDDARGVVGWFLAPDGTFLDWVLIKETFPATWIFPRVVFGAGQYFVVWNDYGEEPALEGEDVQAARVLPDGTVLDDPPLLIGAGRHLAHRQQVAWDGAGYMVVWLDDNAGESRLYATSVDSAGVVLNDTLLSLHADQPVLVHDGVDYIVAWQQEGHLWAARLDETAAVVEPPAILVRLASTESFVGLGAADPGRSMLVYLLSYEVRAVLLTTDPSLAADAGLPATDAAPDAEEEEADAAGSGCRVASPTPRGSGLPLPLLPALLVCAVLTWRSVRRGTRAAHRRYPAVRVPGRDLRLQRVTPTLIPPPPTRRRRTGNRCTSRGPSRRGVRAAARADGSPCPTGAHGRRQAEPLHLELIAGLGRAAIILVALVVPGQRAGEVARVRSAREDHAPPGADADDHELIALLRAARPAGPAVAPAVAIDGRGRHSAAPAPAGGLHVLHRLLGAGLRRAALLDLLALM
jgi:hypothetical protein